MDYDVKKEYINIDNYSPFCHVNEVSPQFRQSPFMLPFVSRFGEERPVHPDTFQDLSLKMNEVIKEELVHPTSSFRTLYFADQNVCYKVPLLRRITRGLRDLTEKELRRSEHATAILSAQKFSSFSFLREECHHAEDPNFNYIKRDMPEIESHPWFYVIKSQEFEGDFMKKCLTNIIQSWMFFASKGIFLEYHTQNLLMDNKSNIIYRDLSDVRSDKDPILCPTYLADNPELGVMFAAIFDRAVCNQNLDHFFRYDTKLGNKEKENIKQLIESEIKKYNLPFPNYSMDFPKDQTQRVPKKTSLVYWRDFQ
ncbi:hypothetical protein HY643_02385 [Candidatus Woesearchaeota archaeon]|nr:hypothetical protein [Candidatus Woesearchaeota archaeon]